MRCPVYLKVLVQRKGRSSLLDKYARLALELGRLPASADVRFKARKDPGFPHDTTFSRLGGKAELVAELLEHCRGREGYEEIVCWCEQYTPRRRDSPQQGTAVTEIQIGFVYLIKSGRFYKIGKTNAAGRRGYELSIQLPERVTTVHVIQTDDPAGIEAYWHKRFEAKRRNGEWFELDATDMAAFKRRKFM